jgi:xanthosine utilization system XapX-like protein
MNLLIAGMVPIAMLLKMRIPLANDPATPAFWFVMSMGLLVGFMVAYPMNWWLIANHLKHGMMTVRPARAVTGNDDARLAMDRVAAAKPAMSMAIEKTAEKTAKKTSPRPPVPVMTVLSFLALAAGVVIAFLPRPL